jgi:predicted nicotinamide N-methyase
VPEDLASEPAITGLVPWLEGLEERHLADLQFAEVTRALRALSASYVERRATAIRRALNSAGKRAAFAMFYGPLHLLLVHAILARLPHARAVRHVLDLGCGTGVAGAAWARISSTPARVTGIDVHPWALQEAAWTYRSFGIQARVRRTGVDRIHVPPHDAVVAAFTVNEGDDATRERLLTRLLEASTNGTRILIVEPIATSLLPWWPTWQRAFEAAGGRADEWRFRPHLPDLVKRLDQAAGLRHDELTARSLYVKRPVSSKCKVQSAK